MEQKLGDRQNKRISGFRKNSETIKSGGQRDHLHKSGLLKEHWRTVAMLLMIYDIVVVNLSYLAALWLRYDLQFSAIASRYLTAWATFTPFYTVFCLVIFIWKYASYTELVYLLQATVLTGAFHTVFITVFLRRMPISYYIIGIMLQFLFMVGIRFSYRFVILLRNEQEKPDTSSPSFLR